MNQLKQFVKTDLRVLFLAPLPPPITGQSVAAYAFLNQMKFDGCEVVVINMSKKTFRQGFSSFRRFFEVLTLVWHTWRAGRGFDIVYLTTSETFAGNLKDILLIVILGPLRSKTWLHLHGGAGMRNLLSKSTSLIGRLNAFFLKRIAGIIVLGERLAPIFDRYVAQERIHIVKNFADDTLFISQDRIDNKWSNTSVFQVLFLSNLLPGKGHEELLEAIVSLPPWLGSQFRFHFAGGFESESDAVRFRLAINGLPNVTYHGVVSGDAKRLLLQQSHIFCLPTYYPYEGQPISILEAYASGCVVLTTNHSGIFDIFTPGKNGWEVQPHNFISIRLALEVLATQPFGLKKIACDNRKEASQFYTRQAHLSSLYAALGLESRE